MRPFPAAFPVLTGCISALRNPSEADRSRLMARPIFPIVLGFALLGGVLAAGPAVAQWGTIFGGDPPRPPANVPSRPPAAQPGPPPGGLPPGPPPGRGIQSQP